MPPKARGGSLEREPRPNNSSPEGQDVLLPARIYYLPSETPDRGDFDLRPHLKAYGIYFPTILKAYLAHDGHGTGDLTVIARYRARLWKILQLMRDAGAVSLEKRGYSVWQVTLTENGLNLIRRMQNSNSFERPPKGIYSLPRRARPERYRALNITARSRLLTEQQLFNVSQEFDTYLDDVRDRSVILTLKSEQENPQANLYFLPYKTRFTAYDRKKANLDTYEGIWTHAVTGYKDAVFVTLTTDPKMHESAYHANKHFQKALNRFMARINKGRRERLKYLNVHEFTAKGLLHSHIIIFGLDYLVHHRRLSEIWKQCGQGNIVYIYGLRNNGTAWTWSRARPKDAKKGRTVDRYLKKYLKKALFEADELGLYWTFNKRFFTYSRDLKPVTPAKPQPKDAFTFIGSARSDEISVLLDRRSRQLWSLHQRRAIAAAVGPPSI